MYFEIIDSLSLNKNNAKLRGYLDNTKPKYENIFLPVSSVSSLFCPAYRDIYLAYVFKIKQKKSSLMLQGSAKHSIISNVFNTAKECSGLSKEEAILKLNSISEKKVLETARNFEVKDSSPLFSLWKTQTEKISDYTNRAGEFYPEMKIDGRKAGLSKRMKIDLFHEPSRTIFEFKSGKMKDYHMLQSTGYAIAFESEKNLPVDYACIAHICDFGNYSVFKNYPHLITDTLRKKFLNLRDKKAEIIYKEKDPGICKDCSVKCGYYEFCHKKAKDYFFNA